MKIDKKLKNNLFVFLALFVLSSFLFGNFAFAAPTTLESAIASTIGYIVQFFVWILGGILMVLIYVLIWVAQYNDFIKSPAVTTGWVIVRDICNMFFILILLVISFATLLKLENYNAKKLLPKLLIMAVLINFSKTICGVLIDVSQVVMLTFVNAFKGIGGGNLTELLGIKYLLSINTGDNVSTGTTMLNIVGAYILALLYVVISVVVVFVILSALIIRMVMLWIYIVLSPIAYLGSAFPSGQRYASQWWDEFTKQLIIGPVLAFFIWLSFSIASTPIKELVPNGAPETSLSSEADRLTKAGPTEAGNPENMLKFIIAIGMLMGGLMVAQQLGGIAGGIAGNAISRIKGAGAGALRKTQDFAQDRAALTARLGARTGLRVGGSLVGVGASKDSLRGKIGGFAQQWGGELASSRQKEREKARQKTLEKLGMSSDVGGSMEKLKAVKEDPAMKRVTNATKMGAYGVGVALTGGVLGGVPAIAMAAASADKAWGVIGGKKGAVGDALVWAGGKDKIKEAEKEQEETKKDVEKEKSQRYKGEEASYKYRLDQINRDEQTKIRNLGPKPMNTAPDNVKDIYNSKLEKINKDAENERKDEEDILKNNKSVIDKDYKDRLEAADQKVKSTKASQTGFQKTLAGWSGEIEGPHELTVKAIGNATADNAKAKEIVEAIEKLGDKVNLGDHNKTFYSQSGPSSKQNKVFDYLAGSKPAIDSLVKSLNALSASGRKLNKAEIEGIKNLKQGIAAQLKGGKEVDSDLIDAVDAHDIEDNMKVADYKDKVVGR